VVQQFRASLHGLAPGFFISSQQVRSDLWVDWQFSGPSPFKAHHYGINRSQPREQTQDAFDGSNRPFGHADLTERPIAAFV
jgi:hypothetical protein